VGLAHPLWAVRAPLELKAAILYNLSSLGRQNTGGARDPLETPFRTVIALVFKFLSQITRTKELYIYLPRQLSNQIIGLEHSARPFGFNALASTLVHSLQLALLFDAVAVYKEEPLPISLPASPCARLQSASPLASVSALPHLYRPPDPAAANQLSRLQRILVRACLFSNWSTKVAMPKHSLLSHESGFSSQIVLKRC
jgi:hypothetical protein